MPYSITQRDSEWCVIKDDDGAMMGCHPSENAAAEQIQALYAGESQTSGVEIDALKMADPTPNAPPPNHQWKSLILPPPNEPFIQKVRSFLGMGKDTIKSGSHVFKGVDGARYMFLISSNAYEDRERETMTSKALSAYEASCYPGAGLFNCDNPLLWFHDPDVPIGTIEAVNYSQPFLIELAKELPDDPVAKVIWDFAEQNGDNAGASIKFGYLEEDRNDNGEYTDIVKLETSYLPERALAANVRTYAGVINDMSSKESDKRLNEIFAKATGGTIENAAEMIHAKSGEFKKKLAALGQVHKALDDPTAITDETDEAVAAAEDGAEMEAKQTPAANIGQLVELVSQIYALVMQQVDGQEYLMESEMALAKSLKALKDERVAEKAADSTLATRVAAIERQMGLTPRSVSQVKGSNPEAVSEAIKKLTSDVNEENLVDVWGFKVSPPIDYTK